MTFLITRVKNFEAEGILQKSNKCVTRLSIQLRTLTSLSGKKINELTNKHN